MNLRKLMEIQNAGAIKIVENKYTTTENDYTLGGVRLNENQARQIAMNLGWEHFEMSPFKILDKTNKFISSLSKYIDNEIIINNTDISFQNRRKMGTMSYFDRIKIVCYGKFDLTVLYGMPGLGGTYGVFSSTNNFQKTVFSCRSLKELGKWINELA